MECPGYSLNHPNAIANHCWIIVLAFERVRTMIDCLDSWLIKWRRKGNVRVSSIFS
jgi:hypothetical protein